MDPVWLIPAWIGSAIWLWIAWRIHLEHSVAGPLRKVDLAIRWLAAGTFGVAGAMGLTGALGLPLFIALKLIILAACILTGLLVRRLTADLGPALGALAAGHIDADERIARSLAQTRPAVLLIWLLLLTAASLGLWTPA